MNEELAVPREGSSPIDPYLAWGLATDFRFVQRGAGDVVGLLVRWRSASDAALAAQKLLEGKRFEVAETYLRGEGPERDQPSLTWTLSIGTTPQKPDAPSPIVAFLSEFTPLAEQIELASAIGGPGLRIMARGKGAQTDSEVLVAVLDDGCAFANARFLRGASTRVAWLWDQNADSPGAPLSAGFGPWPLGTYNYGGQWSRADLDTLLAAHRGSDEPAYADAGLASLRRAAVHGTHVMDLLCGGEDGTSGNPVDVVFVQFPREAVDDPSGLWLDRYAVDGLKYVIDCAGPKTRTIIVNLSWGPQTGAHDGSSVLEQFIDDAVQAWESSGPQRRMHVCLPAGNSFAARAHAQIPHRSGGQVHWIVPPDGTQPQFLEVWWPHNFPTSEMHLKVTPPGGTPVDVIHTPQPTPDQTWHWELATVNGSPRVTVFVHPTEYPDPAYRGAHGRWTIRVGRSKAAPGGHVHVYVARADHNMGARRRAKASHLTDEGLEDARFVAPHDRDEEASGSRVRHEGTLNGIATGGRPYVVAGYRESDRRPAPYSSSGPSRGARSGPDAACVTDRSPALPGVRASGVRSGTSVTLIGTSTAAPQLGRRHLRAALARPLPPPLPPQTLPPQNQPPAPLDPHRAGAALLPPIAGVIHPK